MLQASDRESNTYARCGLLYFVDVDGRVITSPQAKGKTTDDQLQRIASIGRKRHLVAYTSAHNDQRRRRPYSDTIDVDLHVGQQRYERRSQCVGYPVSAVRIHCKRGVVSLANRRPDNKRCLTEWHGTANNNGNSAAVVVEQNRRQPTGRPCRSCGPGCSC